VFDRRGHKKTRGYGDVDIEENGKIKLDRPHLTNEKVL